MRHFGCQPDRLRHIICQPDGHHALQNGLQQGGILAHQYGAASLLLHGRHQRREIRALAVTTGNQHQLPGNTVNGRQRGAHIGPLGIIEPAHAVLTANVLHTVRQPLKLTQGVKHVVQWQTHCLTQCQRCQCIGQVMLPFHADTGYRHDVCVTVYQPGVAIDLIQPIVTWTWLMTAKAHMRVCPVDQ